MELRAARKSDAPDWERMRQLLWPSAPGEYGDRGDRGEHAREIARFFEGDRTNPAEVLLACDGSGRPVGFVELFIRNYAEGCSSRRVAYLEGWFVEADARGRGVGRALVEAAEVWARGEGCTELASDRELENTGSAEAHRALGFEETARIVCYRKSLQPG